MLDVFTLTARRDIAPPEELAMDYAMIPGDPAYRSEWECRCGALECRGRVTGAVSAVTTLRA